jgi:hypothetical protein
VFSRDDATGTWTASTLAQDRPIPGFLPQVRSFGRHRDHATGVDLVFAGQDPRGVFSGAYDPAVAGRIRWSVTPELDLSSVSAAGISGSNGYLRVSSMAANFLPATAIGRTRRDQRGGRGRRYSSSMRRTRAGGSTTILPSACPTAGIAIWRSQPSTKPGLRPMPTANRCRRQFRY